MLAAMLTFGQDTLSECALGATTSGTGFVRYPAMLWSSAIWYGGLGILNALGAWL